MKHHPGEPARALRLEQGPIDHAFGFRRKKRVPVPFGVEPGELFHRPVEWCVRYSQGHRPLVLALIDELDLGLFRKRHIPVAVTPAVRGASERQRVVGVETGGTAEKISDRRPDARFSFAVPFDLQRQFAEHVPIFRRGRRIDLQSQTHNRSRTLKLHGGDRFSGAELDRLGDKLIVRR